MNAIWEFLFCPAHGIFAPANWVFIIPALAGVRLFAKNLWNKL